MKRIRLFCFPYAGGSAVVYGKWKMYLDGAIELVPIEYAGRGKRIKEDFYSDMAEAIDDICHEVSGLLQELPFAVFGHSMGSILGYEICNKIRESCGKEPAHIFVSGRYPPHIHKTPGMLHLLSDQLFAYEMIKIGGTSKEIFDSKELREIFIPILKADYRLIELYDYVEKNAQFQCGITAFGGRTDPLVTSAELLEWQKHSRTGAKIYQFDGNHFFIHDHVKEITAIINNTLSPWVR